MSHLISIIVPVYNSATILPHLLKAIDEEREREHWNLELLLIDDGSRDESYSVIERLSKQYDYIRGFQLSRNFGHQPAVRFGLRASRGEYVAIIDDDIQDPPNLLPRFFKYLDEGWDVAYGVRKKRKEWPHKILSYVLFYRLLSMLSEHPIPLDAGDFCVMKRRVVDAMLLLSERNPFLRGIRAWVGFKQVGVEYERQDRYQGESGYTFKKLLRIASDGIFSFSNIPLQIATYIGAFSLIVALVFGAYTLFMYFTQRVQIQGFTALMMFVIFFGSINMICIGIIGTYIARIYAEGKFRPDVIVAEQTHKKEPIQDRDERNRMLAGIYDQGKAGPNVIVAETAGPVEADGRSLDERPQREEPGRETTVR
jgi:polyisoprenyl-phosphate glycosyltransferase